MASSRWPGSEPPVKGGWDIGAERLGLRVADRDFRGEPLKLVGQIGPFDIRVRHRSGSRGGDDFPVEGSPGRVTFTVGFPPGPWDDHRITVKRGALVGRKLRGRRYVETGDGLFDQQFVVRLRGTKRNRATREWVGRFLTADGRKALLNLQLQLGDIGLTTGRGSRHPVRSEFRGGIEGSPANVSAVRYVRAIVACAEVLIKEH